MDDFVIHGRSSAFNVQKVLWLADELALDYRHVERGGRFGGLDDADFRALNPHGKVPVLLHGQAPIWESHTILRYLATLAGATTLYPPELWQRSRVDRWLDWSLAAFQPDFMQLFWGFYRCPAEQRDDQRIAAARRACVRRFETLAAELAQRPWLAGETFSIADIPIGTSLHRYTTMGLDVELPAPVADWHARLVARPAYRARVMTDYSALAGRAVF